MAPSRKIPFEVPRRAIPGDLAAALGDRYEPGRNGKIADYCPPGHRFLLYFHALSDFGEADLPDDKRQKKEVQDAAQKGDWRKLSQEVQKGRARITGEWQPLKNQKRIALEAAAEMGAAARRVLEALNRRQGDVFSGDVWEREVELRSPLVTGSGNPHPVENGFAFLSPHGVPYVAGSGLKGVLRRAAEELALLCDDPKGWTLPAVWAVFGFDEKSAYLEVGDSEWVQGYQDFVGSVKEKPDPILQELLKMWFVPHEMPKDQATFLNQLRTDKTLKRAIHSQGLVMFQDAFPDKRCRLAVDILNPHHRDYYQVADRNVTPHDAEQPVPIFFLALQPGAKFVLRAKAVAGKTSLPAPVGDWKGLLDAALEHSSEWLGFGAKSSVGYGVMGLKEKVRKEGEVAKEGEPKKGLAEEAFRTDEKSEKCAEKEQGDRQREVEPHVESIPEPERITQRLRTVVERYLSLSETEKKKERSLLNQAVNEACAQAVQWESRELRESVADYIEEVWNQVGWADPGLKKKKKEKQEEKRRKALADLRAGKV